VFYVNSAAAKRVKSERERFNRSVEWLSYSLENLSRSLAGTSYSTE
jgi:hypothetical protein